MGFQHAIFLRKCFRFIIEYFLVKSLQLCIDCQFKYTVLEIFLSHMLIII